MISLGIGELVSSSSLILRTFFGGEEGITTNRAKLAPFFGHKFGPQIEVYYLIAVWCFFCVLAMYALTRTPFGRMCNAVRDNPERVEFVGYSPRMLRLIAFCFAAFFAGIAGGLAAINFEIMNAQQLGAQQSSLVLLMAYIGGVGSFTGPIVGAVIITFLQIMLSDVTSAWQLYFGLMFIGVVLFAPEGVVGWIDVASSGAARRRRVAARARLRAVGAGAGRERRRRDHDDRTGQPASCQRRAAKGRRCGSSASTSTRRRRRPGSSRSRCSSPAVLVLRLLAAGRRRLGRRQRAPAVRASPA